MGRRLKADVYQTKMIDLPFKVTKDFMILVASNPKKQIRPQPHTFYPSAATEVAQDCFTHFAGIDIVIQHTF